MPFKKGVSGNTKGKPQGAKNETTKQAKELITIAIQNHSGYFNEVLLNLKDSNPVEYAKIIVSLIKYVMPIQVQQDLNVIQEQPLFPDVI